MGIIVRGSALAAAAKCTSEEPARPQLQGVWVGADGTIAATDGHVLLEIKPEASAKGNAEEWPKHASGPGEAFPAEGVVIPRTLAEGARGLAPKKHAAALLVDRVALYLRGKGASVEAWGTDLDTARSLASRPIEGPWPDYKRVIPREDQAPVLRIAFNPKKLRQVLAAMESAGVPGGEQCVGVVMEFHGPLKACVIRGATLEGQAVLGLVMPLRHPETEPAK